MIDEHKIRSEISNALNQGFTLGSLIQDPVIQNKILELIQDAITAALKEYDHQQK